MTDTQARVEKTSYRRLRSNRLYVGIVEQITEAIKRGQMHPGDQLPTENDLAEQFGVSRTVVREAIKALSSQGLVVSTPGRGMFITQPPVEAVTNSMQLILSLEDTAFDDLLAARRVLEVPIAGLAAANALPSNLEALEESLMGMRESLHELGTFIDHDTAFHGELARATQNVVLTLLIQPVLSMLNATRQIATRVPGVPERALSYHEQLFEAVANGNADEAERIMAGHLAQVASDTERAREIGLLED